MIEYKRAISSQTRIISRMVADTSPEFYEYLLSERNIDIYTYSFNVSVSTSIEKYTDVALFEDQVVGISFSYNSKFHAVNDEMRNTFSDNILNGLKECYQNVIENTLFLDSLYVDQKHRKKGIAKELLKQTFEKAESEGLNGVSLFTLVENSKAVNLYKNSGFEIKNTFNLVPAHKAYLFYKSL